MSHRLTIRLPVQFSVETTGQETAGCYIQNLEGKKVNLLPSKAVFQK
jgi:hypothetical protein